MSEMYFAFREQNWWEHESWYSFFKLEENFEAMWLLNAIANKVNESSNEVIKDAMRHNQGSIFTMRCRPTVACSKYFIQRRLYTRDEAEEFCKKQNERNGYKDSIIYDKPLKTEELRKLIKQADYEDPFYKGSELKELIYKRVPKSITTK